MWLLLFVCTSTVGGVPINAAHNATSPAPGNVTVITLLNLQQSTMKDNIEGGLPLNDTHNVTSPASGNVTVITLLNLQQSTMKDNIEGGLPLNDTHNVTSPASGNVTVITLLNLQQSTMKDNIEGGLPLNDTHNVTSPASGAVIDPPQQASAETLEELQEDLAVQEGDMLLPEDRNAVETLWADATVPYIISDELGDRESNILAAFKMITDVTCIRFQRRTTELNYLKFVNGKGCASFVGCQGGAQQLYYGPTCGVGNLCHEIIHALGLHHEHTRKDRDQYVTVQWDSIIPGNKKYFKMKHGNTLNLPYDLNSIMHYGQYFFSQDGSPTVLPKQGGVQMGQRTHLSTLDIQRLNKLYHCDERRKSL